MKVKIEFPELHHDFWVELDDPKWMSWGEKQAIIALIDEKNQTQSGLNVSNKLILSLVRNGHMFDKHNNPIPFPLTEEGLERMPSFAAERIAVKVNELAAEATKKNS